MLVVGSNDKVVRVFVRGAAGWDPQGTLTLPGRVAGFGRRVWVSADTALVTAEVLQGLFVFVRASGHWNYQQTMMADLAPSAPAVNGTAALLGGPGRMGRERRRAVVPAP